MKRRVRRGPRGRPRRIVVLGAPDAAILRRRSRRVARVDAAIRALVADLFTTMRRARGAGLAAPQVGVPLRVFVADTGTGRVALVNPRVRRRRGTEVGPEGCLSIPGVFGPVRRARLVEVEGRSAAGRRTVVRAAGLLARVLQHEIDHLNGVLFLDRVERGAVGPSERAPARAARRRRMVRGRGRARSPGRG